MSPNNNNYFAIIIRIFLPAMLPFRKYRFFTFFLPVFSLLFIESKILQTIYII